MKNVKIVSPATFVNKSDTRNSVNVVECVTNISNIYAVD